MGLLSLKLGILRGNYLILSHLARSDHNIYSREAYRGSWRQLGSRTQPVPGSKKTSMGFRCSDSPLR